MEKSSTFWVWRSHCRIIHTHNAMFHVRVYIYAGSCHRTISFSLGILWIFLFPAVCITSGLNTNAMEETKASSCSRHWKSSTYAHTIVYSTGDLHVRGIYMSESGLIPGRAFISYSHTEVRNSFSFSSSSFIPGSFSIPGSFIVRPKNLAHFPA